MLVHRIIKAELLILYIDIKIYDCAPAMSQVMPFVTHFRRSAFISLSTCMPTMPSSAFIAWLLAAPHLELLFPRAAIRDAYSQSSEIELASKYSSELYSTRR